MSVELLHAPVLVVVDASHAVHAVFLLVERPATFALVFVLVDPESGWRELLLPVGEATLLLVSAKARLNPVLAHLSLVFLLLIRRWCHFLGGCGCGRFVLLCGIFLLLDGFLFRFGGGGRGFGRLWLLGGGVESSWLGRGLLLRWLEEGRL